MCQGACAFRSVLSGLAGSGIGRRRGDLLATSGWRRSTPATRLPGGSPTGAEEGSSTYPRTFGALD